MSDELNPRTTTTATETEQQGPDDREPTPERQSELEAAYEANVAAGKAPYEGVEIRTRGELQWVRRERGWKSGRADAVGANLSEANLRVGNVAWTDYITAILVSADLSEERRVGANLSGAYLVGANLSGTDLRFVTLSQAELSLANLSGADLLGADLSDASLKDANLGRADLRLANLSGASLGSTNLSGADLVKANLSGADLRAARMDVATDLRDARLDTHTFLADVVWNGVPVTRLNWQDVAVLGDETLAREPRYMADYPLAARWNKDKTTRLRDYANAVLAYRQVATVLRSQGLNEHADRYAYRAQLMQRVVQRRRHQYLRYIGSLLLDLLAGYGYRPGRAILLYLAIIVWFANFYVWASNGFITFGMPPSHVLPLTWYEALILSVSSFHGRGFQPFQNLNDPVAALAGMQAVFGLVIEVSFIATFTQRFFGK
jgi:uncharacterized protein YjbI with pentapeptide repeats